MSVKIEIYTDTADEARAEMAKLLGAALNAALSSPEASKIIAAGFVRGDDPEAVAEQVIAEASATAAAEPAKRTRKKKDDAPAQQAISTGEERVSPEDDADTAEQDKADEQAEVEATREPEKPVTLDDVKNSFGLYVQKFGMEAVTQDGVNILADALASEKLPEGEKFWKATIIPEARYADVIKAFETAASAGERYKRKGA